VNEPVLGTMQGRQLTQYDYTPEQYAALIKLTAALCKVFSKMKCDYPRDAEGKLVMQKLPDDELQKYEGLIGHWHIQTNKVDSGPAFDWDYIVSKARRLMHGGATGSPTRDQWGNAAMRTLFPTRTSP
jgi:N-acetyl-anhydromuramyl-L-alanine amidase AmpD